jgi:tetratricopeptide (TPR) repeat protein
MMRRRILILALFCLATWLGGPALADEPPKKVALLVGVNQYPHKGFSDLRYAERDVNDLATELKKLGFRTELLTGSASGANKATLQNLQRKLNATLDSVTKSDVVLIALSGHGMHLSVKGDNGDSKEEDFFCPVDAERSNPDKLFSITRLVEKTLAAKGGKNLVLVDACRDTPADPTRGVQGQVITALPENTAVLFSCSARQQSFETAKAGGGHGVFSYCLLEGLRGKAARPSGELTWAGIVAHVFDMMQSSEVRPWISADPGQEPVSTGSVGQVVLGKVANRTGGTSNQQSSGAVAEASTVGDRDMLRAREFRSRGTSWCRQREYDKAIEDFTLAVHLDPKYAAAFNSRGIAWASKKLPDKAIEDYTQALKLESKYPDAYNNRGNSFLDKGELDKAIEDYNQTLAIDSHYAYAYNGRGNAWVEKKHYDKAIADYTRALELDPNYAFAYNGRGNARRHKKDFDQAIADYSEAIRVAPKYAKPYCGRAMIWRIQREYDRAIEDYTKAISCDPRYALAFCYRGHVWQHKKEFGKAIKDYSDAVRYDRNYVSAYKDLARLLANCVDRKLRNGRKSVEYATKACQLTSWKDAGAVEILAAAYAESGNFPEAAKWQRKALEFPETNQQLGRQRLRNYEQAKKKSALDPANGRRVARRFG